MAFVKASSETRINLLNGMSRCLAEQMKQAAGHGN